MSPQAKEALQSMKDISRMIDEEDATEVGYQSLMIALALSARQFLREFKE